MDTWIDKRRRIVVPAAFAACLTVFVAAVGFALPAPAPDPFHASSAPTEVARFSLDTRNPSGRDVTLPQGRYRFTALGTYNYAAASNLVADAECSLHQSASGVWVRNQFPTASAGQDSLDVYINGSNVEWTPAVNPTNSTAASDSGATIPSCDSRDQNITRHEYYYDTDFAGGLINFRILDGDYGDNQGFLEIVASRFGTRIDEDLIGVFVIPAMQPEGLMTPPLLVGQTYRLEVSGTYQYGSVRNSFADAECSIQRNETVWREKFFASGQPENANDLLDLYVDDSVYNGVADGDVSWTPLSGTGEPGTCSTDASHTYSYTYTAMDPAFIGPREFNQLKLFIFDTNFVDNTGYLTIKLFKVQLLATPTGTPQLPTNPTAPSTDPNNLTSTPEASGPCIVDNASNCIEFDVPARDLDRVGVMSPPIPPGTYTIEASGTYQYETGILADAECSRGYVLTEANRDSMWLRERYRGAAGAPLTSDSLDLQIAGQFVDWHVKGATAGVPVSCDDRTPGSTTHIFRTDLVWNGDNDNGPAPINFRIYDPGDESRNVGSLRVKIFEQVAPTGPSISSDQPIAVLAVNSTDPAGTFTPTLLAGQSYRLEVEGTYTFYRYAGTGFEADAECSTKPDDYIYDDPRIVNDRNPHPHRFDQIDQTGGDLLDVYVDDGVADNELNDGPITWTPVVPGTGIVNGVGIPPTCAADTNHTYKYSFTAFDTRPLNLKIHDMDETSNYLDNLGVLTVRLYLL